MSSTSSAPSAASPDAGTKLPAASAGVSQTRPSSSVPKVEYQDPDSDITADEAISSVPFQQSLPGSEDDVLLATGQPIGAASAAAQQGAQERPGRRPTAEQIRRRPSTRAWVPNQHGAWGMLIIPPLVGSFIGGWSWHYLLIWPAFWMGYFAFWAWTQWLRTRSEAKRLLLLVPMIWYSAICAVAGLASLISAPYLLRWAPVFAPLLALALWQVRIGKERSLLSGVTTTLAATLMTAVSYDVATGGAGGFLGVENGASTLESFGGPQNLTGWHWAWLVTALVSGYFVGTVPYVKAMIRGRGKPTMICLSFGFHLVGLALVAYAASAGLIGWTNLALWVVLTARALVLPLMQRQRVRKRAKVIRPRVVGVSEIIISIVMVMAIFLP